MTEQVPQLFQVPASVFQQIVAYLANRPFIEVASLMQMIESTVKPVENKSGPNQRPERKRSRR